MQSRDEQQRDQLIPADSTAATSAAAAAAGMVDEILFEFLHMEVVHSLVGQPSVISLPAGEEVSALLGATAAQQLL